MTLPSGTKCYHCFVLKSVPARSRPVRRDGRSSGGRGDASSPHRCGVAEDSSVVDGAEREEVGDAVEVLQAAAALGVLARRRRLVRRLHLFLAEAGGRELARVPKGCVKVPQLLNQVLSGVEKLNFITVKSQWNLHNSATTTVQLRILESSMPDTRGLKVWIVQKPGSSVQPK